MDIEHGNGEIESRCDRRGGGMEKMEQHYFQETMLSLVMRPSTGTAASLPPYPSSSSPLPPQLTDDGQEMTSETCLLDRRSRPLRDANERAALWRERVVDTTIS